MALDPANFTDLLYASRADFTAHANSTSEGTLLAGPNDQPTIPATFLSKYKRSFRVRAAGVISNTGTPTITFQLRLGSVQGASDLTGTSIGVSEAITTTSGITNQMWVVEFVFTVATPGQGANNTTLIGNGAVYGRGWGGSSGLDWYPLQPTTPDTATWTSTVNAAVQLYLNLSATWSAASASNTITCKSLLVEALN